MNKCYQSWKKPTLYGHSPAEERSLLQKTSDVLLAERYRFTSITRDCQTRPIIPTWPPVWAAFRSMQPPPILLSFHFLLCIWAFMEVHLACSSLHCEMLPCSTTRPWCALWALPGCSGNRQDWKIFHQHNFCRENVLWISGSSTLSNCDKARDAIHTHWQRTSKTSRSALQQVLLWAVL